MTQSPEWYDESKLVKIRFEQDERGWAVDMGNGQYRLANNPIRGCIGQQHPEVAQWGDLVELVPNNGDNSWLKVVEKYEIPGGEHAEVS